MDEFSSLIPNKNTNRKLSPEEWKSTDLSKCPCLSWQNFDVSQAAVNVEIWIYFFGNFGIFKMHIYSNGPVLKVKKCKSLI